MDMTCLHDSRVQLGVAAAITSTYILYKVLYSKKFYLPPGPTPLPFVGNLLSTGMKSLHLKFTDLKEKYGPVVTVYLGNQPTVILNSSEAAREAYLTHGDDYAGRPFVYSMDLFTDGGKDIVFGQYGPVWKLQRKIVHAALRKYASGKNLEELVHFAFDEISQMIKTDEPVNPMDYNLMFVYDMMNGVCFGKDYDKNDTFVQFLKNFILDAPQNVGSGFLADFAKVFQYKMFETKGLREWKNAADRVSRHIEQKFNEHMETYDQDNLTDFTYDLIHLWEKAKIEEDEKSVLSQLTKTHFIQVISDMFFAGIDTTRCTLTYFIAYMVNYPEIQNKIYQEIEDVYGTDGYISLSAKDKLPYTMAALMESMRIMPIVPLGIPHITLCDTKLGEYTIPKGTQTMLNVWAIHHDPNNFEDPWTYKPERWLDEDGKFHYHPYKFLSFSMGKRVCVRESFAKTEIPMIVALLLQKYKFERIGGDLIQIESHDLLGLLEPKPFKVIIKLRK